ncbi:uncharacterized protein LOC119161260 isoform X3 [Rhipicephalus microplus]|uniref:uncharacterized protein LOC119161260 isoform X3 n=1 Tax=Rhipicephalus microplus TaxID=6941 RepID=UPI003F6B110B
MKWWCLFLIKDDAGKDIVEDYFSLLNLLMDAPTWKPDSPRSHLLPLIPSREVHFAILPFLLSPCEELQAFWKTFQLDCFQSALQSWSDDIARLKDTYHFPSQLSPAVLTSATKRIEGLLDNLPIPGKAMLEIVVDRSLFSDLDVMDNVMLYGALFRAYMWHHATFRPLGVGSSIEMDKWMNSMKVTGLDLHYEWLPVWKGRFTDGNTTTACHFELQCFVPDTYDPDLKEFLPHYEKPVREKLVDYYSLLSLEGLVWSTSIEVLDGFSSSSLPTHLITPTLCRFVSLSSVQALPAWVLKKVNESEQSWVILRLSYWDDVDMKAKPSTSSSTDWQHNLLMENPCKSPSVGDQCHQEPSGHLHFIIRAATNIANINIVFPWRKSPPFTETCLHSGQESASLPPAVESATSELMQEIPLVCADRILDSLQDDDSLSLASFGDFIASDESFCEDVEELEKYLEVLKSVESDRATDSAEESCLGSPDDMTYASLGDPSDWPKRRLLVSESLKSSASSENCTLSNAGGSPGLKELTISAAEIAKLFDESGCPKRKPLHPVHAVKLRVAVANPLEKNGVSQSSPLYKACGKKLFAICSTFAKDLIGCGRTSELLQNIADSHAKQHSQKAEGLTST